MNADVSAIVRLISDHRVTVWHISLYVALIHKLKENDFKNPVSITRAEVMKLAHIGGIATYHKYIKELHEYGYIEYLPSYDPCKGTTVYFI
jgi:hypothetical protein